MKTAVKTINDLYDELKKEHESVRHYHLDDPSRFDHREVNMVNESEVQVLWLEGGMCLGITSYSIGADGEIVTRKIK